MGSCLNVDMLCCVHTHRFTNCIRHGPWRKQMTHINKIIERNLIKEKHSCFQSCWQTEGKPVRRWNTHSQQQRSGVITMPRPEERKMKERWPASRESSAGVGPLVEGSSQPVALAILFAALKSYSYWWTQIERQRAWEAHDEAHKDQPSKGAESRVESE